MENTPRTPLGSGGQSRRQNGGASISAPSPRTTSLNDRLNTNFVNVGNDDSSVDATVTRTITGCIGNFITPRKLLIVLRILKAITFCFLILNLAADMMYIVFLEITAEKEVSDLAGGRRDLIIRIYGIFLAVVAICIELDYAAVVKSFYGFKGFVPRGLLYFFISAITGARPLHIQRVNQAYDDAYQGGDDDAAYAGDDMYTAIEIPQSAVVFQMVTSFILGLCAITYFVFGCLCLDRFTSKAFLSTNDPLVSTAIPTPVAAQKDVEEAAAYTRSPEP